MSENFSNMGHVNHVHFVGVGGAGMCGIAEAMRREGYKVSGSDLTTSPATDYLSALGVTIYQGHEVKNIEGCDVVVKSTAVPSDNVEISHAKSCGIPVVLRAQMLSELMRFKRGIAVSGTHGKTTTSSLTSTLLKQGGLDPSHIIGGKLNDSGSHARWKSSSYLVVEADESDASFLLLNPVIAIVTNIDQDHMSTYQDDPQKLRQAFIDFLNRLPFYGLAVVCIDDPIVAKILPSIKSRVLTYGFSEQAMVRATAWQQQGLQSHFELQLEGASLSISMPLPGRHNVLNALAAIAVATSVGVLPQAIAEALAAFGGIGRRFQVQDGLNFSGKQVTVIDDYGHHPNEIKATLETVRRVWPHRRLVHVFQLHRFSRTQALFEAFSEVLTGSDVLVLLEIYGAGESPIPGVSHHQMAKVIQSLQPEQMVITAGDVTVLPQVLDSLLLADDVVLFQGAGSIGSALKYLPVTESYGHA